MPEVDRDPAQSGTAIAARRFRQLLRLEGILIVVILIAALKAAAPVILPLVFALFLVAIFFPLQRCLQQNMHAGFATALTLFVLIAILCLLGAIAWATFLTVREQLPSYQEGLQRFALLMESYGISIPGFGSEVVETGGDPFVSFDPDMLQEAASSILGAGGLITLTFSYLVLTLLSFQDTARRVINVLPSNRNGGWLKVARQVSHDFQRYIVVRTVSGLLNGVAVAIIAWLLGLEFAFVWGLLTFLLSYIPIFGTVVSILLPIVYALVQFDEWQPMAWTATAIVAIHAILGNFVTPHLYGKFLKPTPLTILLSVTFWGWLWGLPGAFIAVPLTILLVIICNQFHQTRWVSQLLADLD